MSEEGAPQSESSEERRRRLIEAARRQVEGTDEHGETEAASPSKLSNGVGGVAAFFPSAKDDSSLPRPDSFSGYTILREIHRGAQGVVYQAIQKSMNRKVAIKVMIEGPFAGPSDRARFDREVQILGALKHPNIVTIHGTGDAEGAHFFVMDYISGQPLDVYMASERRGIEETLRLFVKICEAVASAHLRGIIHRDLKPGNIRVDAKAEPYVLDFGLAKSTSDADASGGTMTGRFLGTPSWASPEQAEGVSSNIDIRSDVYSLGVILYQMLTGKFPYSVTGSVQGLLDRIRKAEPIRPRELRREINDEVETIVLRCLRKEPERRYQSAGELGRDVSRYLAGEAIEAKRDSLSYVFRKQLRRYKPQATIAASFVFLIVVGFFVSIFFWQRAEAAEQDAVSDAQWARQAEAKERVQRKRAEDNAEALRLAQIKIEATNSALRDQQSVAFKFLEDVEDFIAQGRLAGQPEIEADLQHMLGKNRRRGSDYDAAERHLTAARDTRREALGKEHEDTLNSANELARVYLDQGEHRYEEAEQLFSETLATCRDALAPDHRLIFDSMNNLAMSYKRQHKYDDAEKLYLEVLDARRQLLSPEHEDTLNSMHNLGVLYRHQGRLEEAAELLEKTLEIRTRPGALKENHRYTLNTMSVLGRVYAMQGRHEEAERLLKKAVAGAKLTIPGHLNTGVHLRRYGRLLIELGRYPEAEEKLIEAHAIISLKRAKEDRWTVIALELLVDLYTRWGKPEKAREYSEMIPPPNRAEAAP